MNIFTFIFDEVVSGSNIDYGTLVFPNKWRNGTLRASPHAVGRMLRPHCAGCRQSLSLSLSLSLSSPSLPILYPPSQSLVKLCTKQQLLQSICIYFVSIKLFMTETHICLFNDREHPVEVYGNPEMLV
jgi:hypothetical protein